MQVGVVHKNCLSCEVLDKSRLVAFADLGKLIPCHVSWNFLLRVLHVEHVSSLNAENVEANRDLVPSGIYLFSSLAMKLDTSNFSTENCPAFSIIVIVSRVIQRIIVNYKF